MGIFKTIFNELFGSKKMYEVKDLGIFTSKVCDWWLDKEYSWGTAVRLPPYSKDTFVLVEGDASAPVTTATGGLAEVTARLGVNNHTLG